MHRLFVALPLPEAIADLLLDLRMDPTACAGSTPTSST